ncbi:hypothetical protein [Mesorhizobium sp. WSM3876]|uniref:hypothetical protein n=1 Tax=Mesorhizobium sp. WSM3876 TaxID=422277 RepID=UPI001596746C|nr:hypothetical protein [Mesorhizobium sp. WSM3876]
MNDASEQLTSAGHAAWSANATHEPASACGQGPQRGPAGGIPPGGHRRRGELR